ncbi:hypothetical protein [Microlunatus parietis]|uniref:hypothetical protein n=1 Tax=Microlunatus parietis TaxID=682979 RepID=UPI0015CBE584|nr:hypothetical protein [Microlunatus parietis]
MKISQAGADDVVELARLLHANARRDAPDQEPDDTFVEDFAQWWAAQQHSHLAYVHERTGPRWSAWPGSRWFRGFLDQES